MRRYARFAGLLTVLAAVTPAMLSAGGVQVTVPAAHVGAWGLEVSIGGACGGPSQIDLGAGSGPLIGLYEACQTLTAQQVAVGGVGATLRAGNEIIIGNDFSVPTNVTAEISTRADVGSLPSLVDHSPIDESVYHATFYIDRGGLTLGAGDEIEHFTAYSASGEEIFRLVLKPDGGGGAMIHLAARQDGGGWIATAPGQEIPLPSGWTELEVSWVAADGTGELRIGVAGAALTGLTALDNDGYTVESVRWGAISGSIASSSGLLRLDAFASWR